MTGEVDYISDGTRVVALRNGSSLLGAITGSGCMVGACIASFCGAASMQYKKTNPDDGSMGLADGDMFAAAIGGYAHIYELLKETWC
jgi:thiamine-phosphate diphosphorylase/hydroxyethylthiazole kinase